MSGPARVRVRVPATSANLGPGFDALGLALGLYDEVVAELAGEDRVEVEGGERSGERADGAAGAPGAGRSGERGGAGHRAARVPTDGRNLALRAARLALPGAAFHLRLRLAIPVGRGLGSSAAAVVGGLVAARALAGEPPDPHALLPLATAVEGHPDNVAPALLGGFCAACAPDEDAGPAAPHHRARRPVIAIRLDPPPLHAVAAVPDRPLPTAQARLALPRQVPFADAVANVQRTALLVAAVAAGRWDALGEATRDRLHQPYRAPLVPGLEAALAAARGAGALAAFLSGAGPTVLALAADRPTADAVAEALRTAFAEHGVTARSHHLPLAARGAEVESLTA